MIQKIPLTAQIQFGSQKISQAEIRARAFELAKEFINSRFQPGEVILVSAENNPAFLIAVLAGFEAELCMVPIDPQMKAEEIQNIDRQVQARGVINCGSTTPLDSVPAESKFILSPLGEYLRKENQNLKKKWRKIPGVVCIQFTSGSTGVPKGLMLCKDNMFWRAENIRKALGLDSKDRTLCTVPLSHSHGTDCLAFPTLLAGGFLSLKNPATAYPYRILDWIESEKITFFSSIPAMYDQFNRLPTRKSHNLKSLRHPFCGSAALASETAVQFEKKFGVRIKQGYGLAEIAVICLNLHQEEPITYESIGKPIEGVDYRIAPDHELFVKGPALFQGYLDMPEETSARVNNGELSTRDLVSQDSSGQLFLIGRKDDFINVMGQKVFPVEIENALSSFPGLQETCVVSEPDQQRTEIPVLHAVALASEKENLLELERKILLHLRHKLEAFKIPQKIHWHPQLPKSPLGKILRSKLKGS